MNTEGAGALDYDGDGDLDLYVGSGGSEQRPGSELYENRIYLNDQGYFRRLKGAGRMLSSTSCLASHDFDQDGDIDLFVGAGIIPGRFPELPQSHLLRNDNGEFTAMTTPLFDQLGMVRDAIWTDLDNDGWADLIVVGHWMEIKFFQNIKGKLIPWSFPVVDSQGRGQKTSGWWNTITSADLDEDGDQDLVLGNQGMNNFINPTQDYPLYVYHGDFDKNGSPDPIQAAYYEFPSGKQLMPTHTRDDILKQLVSLKSRFPSYRSFGEAGFQEILDIAALEEHTFSVKESAHLVLINENGNFRRQALPMSTQIAPINDVMITDVNRDGVLDILAVGNDYASETHFGRYDASIGVCLLGDGKGDFSTLDPEQSGWVIQGQASQMVMVEHQLIVGINNQDVVTFNLSDN